MASPPDLRKAGLVAALAATLYAAFGPNDGQTYQSGPAPVPTVAPIRAPKSLLSAAQMPGSAFAEAESEDEEGGDPFAPRNWLPPVVPEPVKPMGAIVPTAAVIPALPPGPPALPFQFAGRMNDGDEQVIYLARGEQALIARSGEVLENIYKVVSIDASQIEFLHMPTGQKQILPIPGREN